MPRGGLWRTAAAITGGLVPVAVVLAIPGTGVADGRGLIPYVAGPVTGLVLLLVALAAPLQRSGTSTVPAFAFARLGSPAARSAAAISAVAVSLLLTLPLLQVSGALLAKITGMPLTAGVLVAGVALALASALSGTKSGVTGQALALLVRAAALAAALVLLGAAGAGSAVSTGMSALTSGTGRVSAAGLAGAASLFVALACGTAALPQVLTLVGAGGGGGEARATALRSAALTALVLAGGAVAAARLGASVSAGSAGLLLLLLGALAASVTASFAAIGSAVPAMRARERTRGLADFAVAGVAIALTATVLLAGPVDLAPLLGWAFSLAAATLFPVMVLGSWYRGLTATGVVAGVAAAAASTAAAAIYAGLVAAGVLPAPAELVSALVLQPALLTVPLAFAVTALVSRATVREVPADVDARMLRMHAPEELGVAPAAGGEGAAGRWAANAARPIARPQAACIPATVRARAPSAIL
jgi:Na+(H+)/acetate symporter ActP